MAIGSRPAALAPEASTAPPPSTARAPPTLSRIFYVVGYIAVAVMLLGSTSSGWDSVRRRFEGVVAPAATAVVAHAPQSNATPATSSIAALLIDDAGSTGAAATGERRLFTDAILTTLHAVKPRGNCEHSSAMLILLVGHPGGRTVENVIVALMELGQCARLVVLTDDRKCAEDRQSWRRARRPRKPREAAVVDSDAPPAGQEPLPPGKHDYLGIDEPLEARHVESCPAEGITSISSKRPLKWPVRFFGWDVVRVCVDAGPDAAPLRVADAVVAKYAKELGRLLDPSGVYLVDGEGARRVEASPFRETLTSAGAGAHLVVLPTDPCPGAHTLCQGNEHWMPCQKRRRHVALLRREIAEQDAFASVVPFRNRYRRRLDEGESAASNPRTTDGAEVLRAHHQGGVTTASAAFSLVSDDSGAAAFLTTGRLPRSLMTAAVDVEAEASSCDRTVAPGSNVSATSMMSVAVQLGGLLAPSLAGVIERTAAMLNRQSSNAGNDAATFRWSWLAVLVAADGFPVTAEREVAGLTALSHQPTLASLVVVDGKRDATVEALRNDHANYPVHRFGTASSVEPTQRANDGVILHEMLPAAWCGMLRRMYETRCGARFDVVVRLRADTFIAVPFVDTVLPKVSPILWLVEKRQDSPTSVSAGTAFWCGGSRYLEGMEDMYFQLPSIVRRMGILDLTGALSSLSADVGHVSLAATTLVSALRD